MLDAVPNLTTAKTHPALRFEQRLIERTADIEAWFQAQWERTPPPFYCSVDLRNAGYKLAPIDTNLFPAGFNNLNPAFESLCVEALRAAVRRHCPEACDVLLVPESHTRNQYYLESVAALRDFLTKAGFGVRVGSLIPGLAAARELTLPSGRTLRLEPLQRHGARVAVDGFNPCVVLLNNDLAGGRPSILEHLEQVVIPPLGLGWSNRLKSQHFALYREVASEFGALVELDPWQVDPLFRNCGQVDFMKREGEDCLIANVDVLLADIRAKYQAYGIGDAPFVMVKAEAGTYGMGVMTVRTSDDVRDLNRDARKKMAATKEGRAVTGAIIQEGVYTHERWEEDDATAEPVVYLIDRFVVGGFYRVHAKRSNQENLNAPGSSFRMLAFAESCSTCPPPADGTRHHFYAYGVVARLAALAAAREAVAQHPQPAAMPTASAA